MDDRSRALQVSRFVVLFATILAVPATAQQTESALAPISDRPGLPRVLLIGDSISVGYTLPVRHALEGVANVHRVLNNSGPTTKGLEHMDEWLGKDQWDVIHFNFGLHDLKQLQPGRRQVPLDAYEGNLKRLVARLKQTGASPVSYTHLRAHET